MVKRENDPIDIASLILFPWEILDPILKVKLPDEIFIGVNCARANVRQRAKRAASGRAANQHTGRGRYFEMQRETKLW